MVASAAVSPPEIIRTFIAMMDAGTTATRMAQFLVAHLDGVSKLDVSLAVFTLQHSTQVV